MAWKRIYTYGGRPAERNLTLACLCASKATGIKITQVSASLKSVATKASPWMNGS